MLAFFNQTSTHLIFGYPLPDGQGAQVVYAPFHLPGSLWFVVLSVSRTSSFACVLADLAIQQRASAIKTDCPIAFPLSPNTQAHPTRSPTAPPRLQWTGQRSRLELYVSCLECDQTAE